MADSPSSGAPAPKGTSRVVEHGKVIAEWSDSHPAPTMGRIHEAAFTELDALCRLFDVADGLALRDLLASTLSERDALKAENDRLQKIEAVVTVESGRDGGWKDSGFLAVGQSLIERAKAIKHWRKMAFEALRYLNADQIREVTKAAGGEVFICDALAPTSEAPPMPTEPTPLAWLQSRLSDEEHAEFHLQANGSYLAIIAEASSFAGSGFVAASGEGASLEEAVAALRRADAEQQGQHHEG